MIKHYRLVGASFLVLLFVYGIYFLLGHLKSAMEYKALVQEYEKPVLPKKLASQYDVVVIGGEPEGVAAAVSAARKGAKTLLVENREELGGLFTYGMLNFLDIPRGENRKSVSGGIYKEWHEMVGGDDAFDILTAKAAFKKLVDQEPNITLVPETEVLDSIVVDHRVVGVKLKNKYGKYSIKGQTFIDATQDAEFAVQSNVPYFLGGEDIGLKDRKMAVTLMMHLKNVDWKKVKEAAKSGEFGGAQVNKSVVWGFSDLHNLYEPQEEETRLRGLNLVKIGDEYYINALQIFGIDGLDRLSKQEAIEKGKRNTSHILEFLKKEFPGFEQAEIASYPDELYVRETRHIRAEYQLPMADVWTNKDHWDSIGLGAYPVDVQAQTRFDYGYVLSAPKKYAIPFRSLVPQEIDGLLVVGRSSGFSSLAAGSARVVPTGMVAGEAAGAAAALAINKRVTFREMSTSKDLIESLRATLANQGAYLNHFAASYPYEGEWYDGSIQILMNYGLIVAGYNNDLKVESIATNLTFANLLKEVIQRANPGEMERLRDKVDSVYYRVYHTGSNPITRDEAAGFLTEVIWGLSGPNSWETLIEKGLITKELAQNIPDNRELKLKELFALQASLLNYMVSDTLRGQDADFSTVGGQ
ncbi:FAD-dependent oxidoreductase [Cytobacillus depressus]|uniref:FAD-dependent oxidoreductase n=1 Tax=Cytobacillus depressus TaxID=1602942 RepID=A0A6L3V6A3_9BACI|nr:FAD-dependent oxidoreductase [Cytobacillus depressus]KAB2336764.1 FAD-dependent oxidoreductase [Cytobacillus depressus]